MTDFKVSSTILFGKSEELLNLPEFNNILVVTDPFLLGTDKFEKIISNFSNKKVEIISDVKPDPSLEQVVDGVEKAININPEVIVAIGGGSAIDQAKAIMFFTEKINKNKIEFFAIPTTSGSGSEVTSFSVITDTKQQKKIPLVDDSLVPKKTILDKELLLGMPKVVCAYSGIDAISHAIESYVATNATNYSDALSVGALSLLFDNLESSYKTADIEARANVHIGSNMAGIAFNNAGLGANHAIAHQLGGIYHLPHGLCNAMLLVPVIKANAKDKDVKKKYNKLAYDLHLTQAYSEMGYKYLINHIQKICNKLEVKLHLKQNGVTKKEFDENVEKIVNNAKLDACMKTNPVRLEDKEITSILREIY